MSERTIKTLNGAANKRKQVRGLRKNPGVLDSEVGFDFLAGLLVVVCGWVCWCSHLSAARSLLLWAPTHSHAVVGLGIGKGMRLSVCVYCMLMVVDGKSGCWRRLWLCCAGGLGGSWVNRECKEFSSRTHPCSIVVRCFGCLERDEKQSRAAICCK